MYTFEYVNNDNFNEMIVSFLGVKLFKLTVDLKTGQHVISQEEVDIGLKKPKKIGRFTDDYAVWKISQNKTLACLKDGDNHSVLNIVLSVNNSKPKLFIGGYTKKHRWQDACVDIEAPEELLNLVKDPNALSNNDEIDHNLEDGVITYRSSDIDASEVAKIEEENSLKDGQIMDEGQLLNFD